MPVIYIVVQIKFFEEQLKRMQEPTFQAALRERMWKIEGINAEAKNLHTLKRAKYRGLSKVQIQAYMTGAVQNLKRLIQTVILDILSIIHIIYPIKIGFLPIISFSKNRCAFYKSSIL